MGYLIG
jgi:hypothetical protein